MLDKKVLEFLKQTIKDLGYSYVETETGNGGSIRIDPDNDIKEVRIAKHPDIGLMCLACVHQIGHLRTLGEFLDAPAYEDTMWKMEVKAHENGWEFIQEHNLDISYDKWKYFNRRKIGKPF